MLEGEIPKDLVMGKCQKKKSKAYSRFHPEKTGECSPRGGHLGPAASRLWVWAASM